MNGKISTSVQYQVSNVILLNELFYNWGVFYSFLKQGPIAMKQYLFDMWNNVREKMKNDERFLAKDIDKNVTVNDFNVTFNRTKNNTDIYFITFPDYEYYDAASKYVAIAMCPSKPRYFTLEYSSHVMDNTPCWVLGEFVPDGQGFRHINYGSIDNMRLTWFCGNVIGRLESENL